MRRFNRHLRAAAFVAAGALFAAAASALQQTQPATQVEVPTTNATTQHLRGTITAVSGLADMRRAPDADWEPCKVGMEVDENAELRTGPHSLIQFVIPPDQRVTLDRFGTMTVLQAVRTGGRIVTDLGMKYGRMEYKIEAAGLEHRSTVKTPNSTLGVRGTTVQVYDQRPFPPQAVSLTGRAQYAVGKHRTAIGGKNTGIAVANGQQTPAQTALGSSVQDPVNSFARSALEQPLVANLLSQGAVVTLPPGHGIPIVRGGMPPTDQQLIPLLPGRLDFVLRWTNDANLDLIVGNLNGKGEAMLPASGLNTTPSGGRIPFDHRGGPHGGFEIGFWPKSFPDTIYPVQVNDVSGVTTPFTLDTFKDGQRVPMLNPAGNGGAGQTVTTLSGTLSPGQTAGAIVPLNVPLPPTGASPQFRGRHSRP